MSAGPPIRVVSAASLFDGHDAAINVMRRLLQAQGAEVIHLGHDRSVAEIVEAAIQEDAHAVAVSSYQGGHLEFFGYLVDQLRARGAGHIRVYGGGGGTIVPEEIAALHARGVARIFSPEDGRALGLEGMIGRILDECRAHAKSPRAGDLLAKLSAADPGSVAPLISFLECAGPEGGAEVERVRTALAERASGRSVPVIGFTGTGGAGKSSVVDEVVRRFRLDFPSHAVGIVLVDPTRRRSGGALLGDRIRMNGIHGPGVFVRSLATRRAHLALSAAVRDATLVLRAAGFDLVFVETAGIGQSDSEVVDLADASIYVMTPEFGAPTQLEKIDMLELADLVVLNKCDRRGADDALRDVRRQWRRNHAVASPRDEELPIFPTVASQWDDPGLDRLYAAILSRAAALGCTLRASPREGAARVAKPPPLIPPGRERYLAEVAEAVRAYRRRSDEQARLAREAAGLRAAEGVLAGAPEAAVLHARLAERLAALDPTLRSELEAWPETRARYEAARQAYGVRSQRIEVENHVETLSGTQLPRVSLPRGEDWGELARFLRQENLPGHFPFTAGVFPFKRAEEDPARMFAGEGPPERTNRRFHLVAAGQPATRLSTAFDSVTLYGRDPEERLDVWGKVGTSGVSVCTVDDAKKLYSGFDLADPRTSVSMTINGPAPTVLAFFLNAAIDQQVEKQLRARGELEAVRRRFEAKGLPAYGGPLPPGHDGLGLGLLGISGEEAIDAESYARIRSEVLARVRGTVQADILKEDQAQNTCIFSTAFSLKLMGDVQEWFVAAAGAELLRRLDLGLSHRRGRGLPDHAARLHARERLHLPRSLARARHAGRRLRAELLLLLQQRPRRRVQRDRPGGAAHLGDRAARAVRRLGAQPEAQVPHPDLGSLAARAGDGLQRHPHHAPGADRAPGPLQQPAHQRLRRGGDHADRGIGAPRARDPAGDPARARHREERERATGLLRHRVADRPGRGGRARGVRAALRARRRARRDGDPLPARPHPGREPALRGDEALRRAADRGRQHLRGEGRRAGAAPRGADARERGREAPAADALHAFQARHRASAVPALARLKAVARAGGNVFAELMETVKVASLGQISEALFEVGGRYRRSL